MDLTHKTINGVLEYVIIEIFNIFPNEIHVGYHIVACKLVLLLMAMIAKLMPLQSQRKLNARCMM